MILLPATFRLRATVSGIVVALFVALVSYSFLQGWRRAETDFPNYYTAAVLVLKKKSLRHFYNWQWFQRQMNYAGIEKQLGGYIPQTPLTMLPMIPLAHLAPQAAKRIWLLANLFFLAGTVLLLARIAGFSVTCIVLFVLAGYGSLHVNLLLGQYYIFLLFLMTSAFYFLQRGSNGTGGLLLGVVFALKLYGGPFVLYFAAKRQWRAVAGFAVASLLLGAVAVALFGWSDIVYFATAILPRSLKGETLDPYNASNGTIFTLMRRIFMYEPELNSHPWFAAPGLFFFIQPLLGMVILLIPILMSRRWDLRTGFAGFTIASVLASPNTASYTFLLLLLPITLLMMGAKPRKRVLLLVLYAVLALPMRPSWNGLFPKVWFLIGLFCVALTGAGKWQFSWKQVLATAAIVLVAAAFSAVHSLMNYDEEPGRHWPMIAAQRGAIYSSSPAMLRSGIVYGAIGFERYILRWQHGSENDALVFKGEALNPVALSPEGPIQFELVSHGGSQTCMIQLPATSALRCSTVPTPTDTSAISPDGKWLVAVKSFGGTEQIWLRQANTKRFLRLTGGSCNSFAPVWDLDSQAIVFASDCGRGIGLPALYRARIPSTVFHERSFRSLLPIQ
jgi:hypothetical protein